MCKGLPSANEEAKIDSSLEKYREFLNTYVKIRTNEDISFGIV